jgi:hypothetical protein
MAGTSNKNVEPCNPKRGRGKVLVMTATFMIAEIADCRDM